MAQALSSVTGCSCSVLLPPHAFQARGMHAQHNAEGHKRHEHRVELYEYVVAVRIWPENAADIRKGKSLAQQTILKLKQATEFC